MSDVPFRVVVAAGREKAVRNRHPWVFASAVASVEGEAPPGSLADLVDGQGEFLARGFWNPASRIPFRALSFRREPIDRDFLGQRLAAALHLRRDLIGPDTDAYRLVHGEGDFLPGLVVDRYGETLVVQFGAAGMELLRETLLDVLEEALHPVAVWERSEGPARREEGLAARSGRLRGSEPPERLVVQEAGLKLEIDLRHGQKTGFYLDQRDGRALCRSLARDRRVLDAFAYTGGFALNAVAGGAREVVAIDSAPYLGVLADHLSRNGYEPGRVERRQADVFDALRGEKAGWDLVVLDPPPFAKRKAEVDGACRGYKDINLQAMKLLAPGGLLLTSSCSHHVDPWLFQQVLFGAAKDAGRQVQLVTRMGQPCDHPVSLFHPEGEYLKVFLLRAA